MTTTTLPDKQPTLRLVTMPSDTNSLGSIFGGWIMSQVDIAAAIPAIRRAKGRVATVAVNSFEFHHPVYVGDLVSFYADLVEVRRTSLIIDVEVFAERYSKAEYDCLKVTQARLTFVALDETGRPRVVVSEAAS